MVVCYEHVSIVCVYISVKVKWDRGVYITSNMSGGEWLRSVSMCFGAPSSRCWVAERLRQVCVCVRMFKSQWRQLATGQMKVCEALLPPMCRREAGAPVAHAIVVSHQEQHCHICLKCERGITGEEAGRGETRKALRARQMAGESPGAAWFPPQSLSPPVLLCDSEGMWIHTHTNASVCWKHQRLHTLYKAGIEDTSGSLYFGKNIWN